MRRWNEHKLQLQKHTSIQIPKLIKSLVGDLINSKVSGVLVFILVLDVAISTKITQDVCQCLQNARSKSDMDDLIFTGSALTVLQKDESFFYSRKLFFMKSITVGF